MSYLFSTPKNEPLNDRTESRMVIRRNRSPASPNRILTASSSFSAETPDPVLSTTGNRRKKFSVPSRGTFDANLSGIDYPAITNDIERRRRRIRSISNSVPPLPVSSLYRGYLPRSSSAVAAKLADDSTYSSSSRFNSSPRYDSSSAYDNDKSSYSSARDRRGFLFSSKNGRTSDKINFSDDNRSGTETPSKSTASEKGPDKKDPAGAQVNKNTKDEGASDDQQQVNSNNENTKEKVLSLTLNLSDKSSVDEVSDMETNSNNNNKPRRSASLKVPQRSAPIPLERKVSSPVIPSANHSTDSLPDLETPRTPNNSATRLKRDYHLTDTEITALRAIIKKADLYDQTVRERMFQVLKIEETDESDAEAITAKVVSDKEIESLKQRLFMSRKELDSYISFTKKMEREKRQSISEKEELETKIQWHERRLSRFENENKTLKQERGNLMNQIYELRSKSSKDSGHTRQKSVDAAAVLSEQSKLESSKQRFIHEADVFAQERTKYIKERQRLDEDNRKAHIRNVSLIAQVQHWEKTVKELEMEKDDIKSRLSKMTRQSVDEQRKSISAGTLNNNKLEKVESFDETDSNDYSCLIETIKFDDSEISRLRKELESAEERFENLKNEYRNLEENQITIDHENMALRDTVNVLTNAKEDSDVRLNDIDTKYRESITELKTVSIGAEELEKENLRLDKELELVSSNLAELQQDAVEMELDQDVFKKFLDKLSMELQEKLGEEHVSKDTEAESLQEQAEIVGREIVAHLNPSRKLQEDYEAMKMDKEDLEEEIQFLKFALSNRMEIKNMQKPVEKCDCSKEKEVLKRDYEDAMGRLESLEDEVNRLHQDKQQLLMSFLNLQASQRSSRDVSKIDVGMTTDDDLSDDEGTPSGSYHSSRRNTGTSSNGETSDLQQRLEDAHNQIERLEIEREEMMESLCKQADVNNALKDELEDLKNDGTTGGSSSNGGTRPSSRTGSRPNSAISKSESMASISSERCPNCIGNGNEIRKYLSIIEELTEDKLGLERSLNDLELDKDKAESDLARLTEEFCQMESEMSIVDSEKESTVRSAKEETKLLLRNMQSLQEENQLLEDNLTTMDEHRREVLQNLKQAEEDRLGFIRTLQLISEQKESVEEQLELLKAENHALKSGGVAGNSIVSPSDLPKDNDVIANDEQESGSECVGDDDFKLVERLLSQEQKAGLHIALGRSISTPLGDSITPSAERAPLERFFSTAVTSPREHSIRRVDSLENIATMEGVDEEKKEMARQLTSLKNEIILYKTKNTELDKSLERSNTLLREERKRRLSERSPATTPVKECLNVEVEIQQQQQEQPLNTITELPDTGERVDYVPTRRMSGERRRSGEFVKQSEELLMRPRLSSGSFISDDEATNRRKLYGQRKSSMSLDEMYNLFGVGEKVNMETKVLPM